MIFGSLKSRYPKKDLKRLEEYYRRMCELEITRKGGINNRFSKTHEKVI